LRRLWNALKTRDFSASDSSEGQPWATMGSYMLFECRSETPRKYDALTRGTPNQNDKPESTRTSGTHKLSTPTTNRDKEE
jgi:hypothetical protein